MFAPDGVKCYHRVMVSPRRKLGRIGRLAACLLPALCLSLDAGLYAQEPPSMTAGGSSDALVVERSDANYRITVPGTHWKAPSQPINPSADFERVNEASDAFCMVITEEEPFTLETLREVVLFHARSASTKLSERPGSPTKCRVDGKDALRVEFAAGIDGTEISYQTTCLVAGGIAYQIVCAAPSTLFAGVAKDFASFVDSFRLLAERSPRPFPVPAPHENPALNYRVAAPGAGWRIPAARTLSTADYECRRVSTYAFCQIVAEVGETDLDTLRAVAVANAKSESGEFRLISDDPDTIGGKPSRRVEFLTRVGENAVRFLAQYVVADGVAYQLVCWSPDSLATPNRPDFDAFFRGFALLGRPPRPPRPGIPPTHFSDTLGYRCAAPSGQWRTPADRLNPDSDFEIERPGTQGYALVIGEALEGEMPLDKFVEEVQVGLHEGGTYLAQPGGGATRIDGVEAQTFECTVDLEGITYRYTVTCAVLGGRGYQIYGWSLDELFEKNREDFAKFLASWRWTSEGRE